MLGASLWLSIVIIGLSAAIAISSKHRGQKFLHYAFKPLTMVLIISLAWEGTAGSPSFYGRFILAGLCFSLVGDVFLMLPADRIRQGLLAFLVAHIFYILAFSRGLKTVELEPLIFLLGYGAAFFLFLYRGLGSSRWPVLVYVIAISMMVWLALNRYLALETTRSLFGLIGAGLFLFSDSANGVKRFRKPFPLADVLVLATYFPAQLLIALSV